MHRLIWVFASRKWSYCRFCRALAQITTSKTFKRNECALSGDNTVKKDMACTILRLLSGKGSTVNTAFFLEQSYLTHLSLSSHKRDTDKQRRPRSDAAERGVLSGSTLFALSSDNSLKYGNNKNQPGTTDIRNEPVQRLMVEESIRHKWVKEDAWCADEQTGSIPCKNGKVSKRIDSS